MVLTRLQRRVMAHLASNRSASSDVAGGVVLNKDWPRRSDDIDIFHDTDEEIGSAARRDIETLRDAGFRVRVDIEIYGIVEATVGEHGEDTQIQWMSESRRRFLPLIRDEEWGARLAPADLAVNKLLAASARRKARDFVDLALIGERLCPLGPLVMAAAGKPPHFSPQRSIEEVRRNCMSIWDDDFLAVKGLPDGWTPDDIRERVASLLENAERYVQAAPPSVVGLLAVSRAGIPVEWAGQDADDVMLRAATGEPDAVPEFKDGSSL